MNQWNPIETAPKGVFSQYRTDPSYVPAPKILLRFERGEQSVAYWDWYYADGGSGCTDGVAWVEPVSGECVHLHYGHPTGWMPLPNS